MDNAPYHSRKLDSILTNKTRKEEIKTWLRSTSATFPVDGLKREMVAEVEKI